ncbi:hypothetical protein LCGC14_2991680 [marine sediment metagenome]|uniref:HNH nuclease domain-containing protein n=1 Tax=marine sediment metagenome TaxID=412755 RepID=A0A0F8X4B1_9ZZZZ
MNPKNRNTEQDFWKMANIPEIPNACWPWNRKSMVKGYGRVDYQGKQYRAHRLAYGLAYGPFDTKMMVLHLCRKRSCINPNHLYLGTAKDNATDAVLDGTNVKGEKHAGSKLNERDVIKIRALHENGVRQCDLARMFPVSARAISFVLNRETWRHI